MGGKQRLGMALLVMFLACTSLRDIGLSAVFGRYGFFEVALAAFGTATSCFLPLVLVFAPEQLRSLRLAWREILVVNVGPPSPGCATSARCASWRSNTAGHRH
jgi:Zn-dependent protease